MLLMNKTLIIAGMVLVFASALITIGMGTGQSALACPNTGSGTSAPNTNQTTTNNLDAQLLPSQLTTGQAA